MRLLFDQNLSWRVCRALADQYPESIHVRSVDLASANDADVWGFARDNDFVIVTKDADFHQRSFVFGPPPRVVWIRCGNCSTTAIVNLLVQRRDMIEAFVRDEDAAFLALV